VAEWARRKADKNAADAHEAHRLILSKIRRCAKWMVSLQARNLRLEMLPNQSPALAPGPTCVQELLHQAKEHGKKLMALESSAQAEAFQLLLATVERAGEEARLAAEVSGLQLMVEGQTEFDREEKLFEELRLQDVHDEVHRLREEQQTPKKLKGRRRRTHRHVFFEMSRGRSSAGQRRRSWWQGWRRNGWSGQAMRRRWGSWRRQ
jgi:hypothetical protein